MKNKKRLNFLNTLQMDLAVFFALTGSIIAVDTFEEWFYTNVPTHLSQKENFRPSDAPKSHHYFPFWGIFVSNINAN